MLRNPSTTSLEWPNVELHPVDENILRPYMVLDATSQLHYDAFEKVKLVFWQDIRSHFLFDIIRGFNKVSFSFENFFSNTLSDSIHFFPCVLFLRMFQLARENWKLEISR